MLRPFFILILFFNLFTVRSQDGKYTLGARNAALGGASVTHGDEWSLFNNSGALGRVTTPTAMTVYQNRYGLSEFMVMGGGYVHTTRWANAGIGFYRFGDKRYNQQKASVVIGNKIRMVSLGLGINLVQHHVEHLGTHQLWVFDFGGVAEITPHLFFGAHIFNLKHHALAPTVMKAGLSYRPSDQLRINMETEKEIDHEARLKAGIEYFLISKLAMRLGLSTAPLHHAFGMGFYPKRFRLDYAFSHNSILGAVHELSLAYRIQRK